MAKKRKAEHDVVSRDTEYWMEQTEGIFGPSVTRPQLGDFVTELFAG